MIGFFKALLGFGGQSITPREAIKRLEAGALLLDVREPHEFARGHAPHARSLPLSRLRDEGMPAIEAFVVPGRTTEILLICQSGVRSRMVQHRLAAHPQLRPINVAGGMAAWMRTGLPVARGSST